MRFFAALCCFHKVVLASQFSSPEAALLALEEAFRSGDIEAAVKAKDFKTEAILMAGELGARDPDFITSLAETLELSFRADFKGHGFPDFIGAECKVLEKKRVSEMLLSLLEECSFPVGGLSRQ